MDSDKMDVADDDISMATLQDDLPTLINTHALTLWDSLVMQVGYAASPLLHQRLCWITDGLRDRLVWRADVHDWRHRGHSSKSGIWNAELSVIGVLLPADSWFASRASSIRDLQDCRFFGTLRAPNGATLENDFNAAMRNLNYLMDERMGAVSSKTAVVYRDEGITKLTVRHVPFIVRQFFLANALCITNTAPDRLTDNGATEPMTH